MGPFAPFIFSVYRYSPVYRFFLQCVQVFFNWYVSVNYGCVPFVLLIIPSQWYIFILLGFHKNWKRDKNSLWLRALFSWRRIHKLCFVQFEINQIKIIRSLPIVLTGYCRLTTIQWVERHTQEPNIGPEFSTCVNRCTFGTLEKKFHSPAWDLIFF